MLFGTLASAGCQRFRILPQSPTPYEARLDREGLKIAVRVTKKGFCLGYLAVFHGEGEKGEKQEERCTAAPRRAGAAEGDHDLDSLTQVMAEVRKKSPKAHVVVRSEAGVSAGAVQRVMKAMRAEEAKDAKDADGL